MKGIITADWHLREDKPRCRKDEDWIETQQKALDNIARYAIEKNCNVYVAGDIFHTPSEFKMVRLVQIFAEKLNEHNLSMYYICGNHDNYYHSMEYNDRSAIGLLKGSTNIFYTDTLTNISAPNFGEPVNENMPIVFEHILTFPNKESLPPNVNAITAEELLEKHKRAEWIFTGDYHHNFHFEKNGRHVVNSGCLLRQVADMKDYDCGCYYVDTDNDIVEWLSIGDNESLVDDSYLIKKDERDERTVDFVNKLKETKNISLDFVGNVEKAIQDNDISIELKETIISLLNLNYEGS